MKKLLAALMTLALLLSCCALACAEEITPAAYASYAVTAPVIDGEIDEIWNNSERIWTYGKYEEGKNMAYGYVKILWDEGHLYFLAVVTDPTLANLRDINPANGVNFWGSETNCKEGDFQNPGDWHYFSNQAGRFYYYTGNTAVEEKGICAAKIAEDGAQYIVELQMPVLTEGLTLEEGHFIGFEVSIDDDMIGNNKRDVYVNWKGEGAYWSDVGALQNVLLTKDVTEHPDVPFEPAK